MKLELSIQEEFGTHLSDGDKAAVYRLGRINPYIGLCEEVVLDFSGVRNANSSFINALISGLIEQHGEGALKVLVFKGCTAAIRVLVEAAVDLGLKKLHGQVGA